jgi:phage baseplate assembly protein W
MRKVSKKFVDINPSFEPHPITGDINLLTNEDAIKQAVKSVVMTMRGEKPFRPLFGTEAQVALFENFDPILADDITLSIEDALKVFEPRVKVINIDYLDNIDDNSVDITINYEIVGLPLNQQSLNLILERV